MSPYEEKQIRLDGNLLPCLENFSRKYSGKGVSLCRISDFSLIEKNTRTRLADADQFHYYFILLSTSFLKTQLHF